MVVVRQQLTLFGVGKVDEVTLGWPIQVGWVGLA